MARLHQDVAAFLRGCAEEALGPALANQHGAVAPNLAG